MPEGRARYGYYAHHEGLQGARDMLRGVRRVSESTFRSNVPDDEEARYHPDSDGNWGPAYSEYMKDFVRRNIDMRVFTGDSAANLDPVPRRRIPPRR